MQAIDWDGLRFILAVSRGRSFAAAAKSLAVNESTVSRRISRSESHLASKLFERSEGSLFPTVEGLELVKRAERIEGEIQAAEERIRGTDTKVAGPVSLTAVPIITNHLLVPALPSLISNYPELEVAMGGDAADLSLMQREVDIALRLARPQSEKRALTKKVGEMDYGLYAAKGSDPSRLEWLTYTDNLSFIPQYHWINEQISFEPGPPRSPRKKFNETMTLLEAVRAGLGKTILPNFRAKEFSELERIDDGLNNWSRELWMIVHPEIKDLARVKVTAIWLERVIRKTFSV